MPIVSSAYTVGPLEACGRRWVHEVHTDNLGAVHVREYLSPDQAQNRDAVLAARAVAINDELAQAEAEGAIGGT